MTKDKDWPQPTSPNKGMLFVEIIHPDGTSRLKEVRDPRLGFCDSFNKLMGEKGYLAKPLNPPAEQSA